MGEQAVEQNWDKLLAECDDEPIETPGSIQSCGAMLVWEMESDRFLAVSANAEAFTGQSPETVLLERPREFLPTKILSHTDRAAGSDSGRINPFPVDGWSRRLHAMVLVNDGVVILELEPRDESDNPSHQNMPFDMYMDLLEQPHRRHSEADSLEGYLGGVCDALREFTGYDRVMVYRYDSDGSGEVVAEARRDDLEPYLHLRYPSSDIPPRARELYKQLPARLIADVDSAPVPLRTAGHDPRSIDLSACSFRSPSPVHCEYLRNMGVRGTLVTSIVIDGELWGLIACHHVEDAYCPSYLTRSATALFTSSVASHVRLLERGDESRRLAASRRSLHRSIETAGLGQTLSETVAPVLEPLAGVFEAQGVSVRIDDQWVEWGETPEPACRDRIAGELPPAESGEVLAIDSLRGAGHDEEEANGAAGVMGARFSGDSLVLLWRPDEPRTIRWAGKPGKATLIERGGTQRLRPRASFAEWSEQRRGFCKPWGGVEEELLLEFRSSFSTLLLRHSEQIERLNHELLAKNSEMESFAYSVSHDLKGPVVTMRSLAGLLREDLETGNAEDMRDSIDRIDRAAMRMSSLIDEMLELSRVGRNVTELAPVDLGGIFESALARLGPLTEEAGARVVLQENPPAVLGHALSLERLVENLLINALKHGCPEPGMEIRVGAQRRRGYVRVSVDDDGPGIDPAHHRRIFAIFQRMQSGVHGSGIGLALVEKIAHAHGGEAWVESELGRGASFRVTLRPAEGVS